MKKDGDKLGLVMVCMVLIANTFGLIMGLLDFGIFLIVQLLILIFIEMRFKD